MPRLLHHISVRYRQGRETGQIVGLEAYSTVP